jgi:hypothetical protein
MFVPNKLVAAPKYIPSQLYSCREIKTYIIIMSIVSLVGIAVV